MSTHAYPPEEPRVTRQQRQDDAFTRILDNVLDPNVVYDSTLVSEMASRQNTHHLLISVVERIFQQVRPCPPCLRIESSDTDNSESEDASHSFEDPLMFESSSSNDEKRRCDSLLYTSASGNQVAVAPLDRRFDFATRVEYVCFAEKMALLLRSIRALGREVAKDDLALFEKKCATYAQVFLCTGNVDVAKALFLYRKPDIEPVVLATLVYADNMLKEIPGIYAKSGIVFPNQIVTMAYLTAERLGNTAYLRYVHPFVASRVRTAVSSNATSPRSAYPAILPLRNDSKPGVAAKETYSSKVVAKEPVASKIAANHANGKAVVHAKAAAETTRDAQAAHTKIGDAILAEPASAAGRDVVTRAAKAVDDVHDTLLSVRVAQTSNQSDAMHFLPASGPPVAAKQQQPPILQTPGQLCQNGQMVYAVPMYHGYMPQGPVYQGPLYANAYAGVHPHAPGTFPQQPADSQSTPPTPPTPPTQADVNELLARIQSLESYIANPASPAHGAAMHYNPYQHNGYSPHEFDDQHMLNSPSQKYSDAFAYPHDAHAQANGRFNPPPTSKPVHARQTSVYK